MSPDPIDRLGARLFEAARQERQPRGAEQRALAAIRRAGEARPRRFVWIRWSLAFAAAGVVTAVVSLLWRREPTVAITAEPASALRPARREQSRDSDHVTTVLPPPAIPSVAAPMAPLASKKVKNLSPSAPAAPPSLTDELSTLSLAESALRSGDPDAALAALDRYDHVLKGQKMRAEATVLRIEALARAGQTEAASDLARRFVEQNPDGVLADRARSYIH